jgi:hypothetical protein
MKILNSLPILLMRKVHVLEFNQKKDKNGNVQQIKRKPMQN